MMKYILIVISALVISFWCFKCTTNSDTEYITKWANKHGYHIDNIEQNITTYQSPFYYVNKGQFIYKVKCSFKNHNMIVWFRHNFIGYDIIYQNSTNQ